MSVRPMAALLLVAASCAGPSPRVRVPTGELQPLEPGLEWTYEADGKIQSRSVVGVESVGRFSCHVVETRTGDLVERSWMRWDKEGLKVHRVSDGGHTVDFEDPILLIHRLAGPGASWTFEERHGPVALAVVARYELDEDITMGPRVIRCARIHLVKRVAGRVVVDQTSWYGKDIGLVRMSVIVADEEGESRTTLQLKSCNFLPE
ncbi:MAG TPA: hypothetical protein VFS19_06845 [Planctomycetota bacterium]|nr:hypothetical protein [Planctomycetota bacterium]